MKSYNEYQKAYYQSLYGAPPKQKKEWALFEGSNEVMRGAYALLVWKKKEIIKAGSPEYLLKIKRV